jgi:hypothetical protein
VQRVSNLEFALVAGIINNALASVATSKPSAIGLAPRLSFHPKLCHLRNGRMIGAE